MLRQMPSLWYGSGRTDFGYVVRSLADHPKFVVSLALSCVPTIQSTEHHTLTQEGGIPLPTPTPLHLTVLLRYSVRSI